MNSDLLNVVKNLNKSDYTYVLEEIGKSDRPINRYKVMKNLAETKKMSKTTYIYNIIDEFCPEEYTKGSYLFDLDDIDENNHDVSFKRKLIQKLNRIYHSYPLGWELPDKDDDLNIETLVRFKKTEDGKSKSICIYHGEQNSVYIKFDEPITNEAIITIYDKGDKIDLKDNNRLFIIQNKKRSESKRKNKDAKLSFYIRKYNPRHRWYLDVILSEKAIEHETNPKIKKYWDYVKYINSTIHEIPQEILYEIKNDNECIDIIRNKKYWKYRLNLRGFLQYLYGESLLEGRRKSTSKSEIGKVISNNLVLEIAPFLKYWKHLDEAGFNVIKTLEDIGKEFIKQLDIYKQIDPNYLLRQISERYFTEVEVFFNFMFNFNNLFYLQRLISSKKIDQDRIRGTEQKLLEYRIFMLRLLNKWTAEKLEYVTSKYQYYCEEYQRLYHVERG